MGTGEREAGGKPVWALKGLGDSPYRETPYLAVPTSEDSSFSFIRDGNFSGM